jgi:N-acetylglutamate synthase-like GNAT family acetyltransferase
MNETKFKISKINEADKSLVADFIADSWGSPISVSRGKSYDTPNLPGFICKQDDMIIGLVTYNIENNECEIVTLDSKVNNRGMGIKLINRVIERAKEERCKRVWLITTNDNSNAIRFYQKRGFEWAGFYKDSMEESRKIKPPFRFSKEDAFKTIEHLDNILKTRYKVNTV